MAKPIVLPLVGDNAAFDASMAKSAGVAEATAERISKSYKGAASSASIAAKEMGASVDEQIAAAAKASVAWSESYGKMSVAARNAGSAAQQAARRAGAAVDVQSAAYTRGARAAMDYEAATAKAAEAADAMAAKQAAATKKAAEGAAAFGKSFSKLGKYTAGGTVVAAVFSVKGATDLQSQMEKIKTQAGATQQTVNALTKGILNMAGSVGTSPQELAQGMYHVASAFDKAGLSSLGNAAKLNVLKIAAQGAKIGGANLVDVTNALDAAVVSGISGVQNYSQAMGTLNSIVGAGDMTMQNLADALGTGLLAPMKTYGLSLKDVGGALAVFGDNNIRGQEAATKLTSAVRIMAAPSEAASKALGAVNLSTLQLANDMRSGGLVGALTDLKQHLVDSGATASQQALVITRAFGGRQSTGVQLLLNQLDRLKAKTDQAGSGAGQFGADWAATTKTLSFQADQLKSTVEVLGDKFGLYLIPKLEAVADWFEKNEGAAKALAAVVAGVLTASVGAFVVGKAAAMSTALKGMSTVALGLAGRFTGAAGGISAFGGAAAAATPEVSALDSAAIGLMDTLGPLSLALGAFGAAAATLKAAGGINGILGGGGPTTAKGVEAQYGMPKTGETERKYVASTLGLPPNYQGGALTAKTYLAGSNDKDPADQKQVDQFFNWLNSSGHFGQHGFTSNGDAKVPGDLKSGFSALQNLQAQVKTAVAAGKATGLSKKAQAALGLGGSSPAGSSASSAATSAIPAAVATMLSTAQSLIGTKYTWGGGHNAWDPVAELKKIGVDCSGFVSQVLHAGGVQLPGPLDTTGLAQNLKPGQGGSNGVTVWDRANAGSQSHTIMDILGKWFESGGNSKYNPAGGVSQITPSEAEGELAGKGFLPYHPLYSSKLASDKTLSKLGVPNSTGGTANSPDTVIENIAKDLKAIAAPANSMIERYGNAIQAKSVNGLDNALGGHPKAGSSFMALGNAEIGTPQNKAYQNEYAELIESGQNKLAAKLAAAHMQAMKALGPALIAAVDKPAQAILTKLGNATQTGSISGLERDLGVHTHSRQRTGVLALQGSNQGSSQEAAFLSSVKALVGAGQQQLAQKLVTAHTQAMEALGREMVAKQDQASAETLNLQATKLQDQTTAITDAASGELTAMKDAEQKVTDMAAAVVQKMTNVQQTTDDTMAAMATATKDQATVNSDLGQSNIDAINDAFQTQIDTLGEKGLYGLNLLAQQQQVQADEVKSYWDQQIDLMQLQLDKDQQAADAAENAAKVNVDQVTTTQQLLVAAAQTKLDNVTANQDARITRAQAHADAVQAHVDAAQVGPAQIAVDMNANASKATQDLFAAQLAKATAAGSVTVGAADKNLAAVTGSANANIQTAQNNYDTVNNAATVAITNASNALSNLTDTWNNTLANDQGNLSSTQTAGTTAEAIATGTAGVTGAEANTQYAGTGGTTIIVNGTNLADPQQTASEIGWKLAMLVPA